MILFCATAWQGLGSVSVDTVNHLASLGTEAIVHGQKSQHVSLSSHDNKSYAPTPTSSSQAKAHVYFYHKKRRGKKKVCSMSTDFCATQRVEWSRWLAYQ